MFVVNVADEMEIDIGILFYKMYVMNNINFGKFCWIAKKRRKEMK